MNILLFGGTGLIGKHLSTFFQQNGHRTYIVTRKPEQYRLLEKKEVHYVSWDSTSTHYFLREVPFIDVVINLAGEPLLNKRWSNHQKEILLESRVKTTDTIVELINQGALSPTLFINASAVGFYGYSYDKMVTEDHPNGNDYLATICKAWEDELLKLKPGKTNLVIMRFGIVLAKDGGFLTPMKHLFNAFIGGTIGPGYQYLSWVHIDDLVGMFQHVLSSSHPHYLYNAVSPYAVTYSDFSKSLQELMKRPAWIRYSSPFLKLVLGERSIVLLHGQRALPRYFLKEGFNYRYADLNDALQNLLTKS